VVFCIVFFSFKTNFFFAKTRDGFEGVQRRGPVKGAGKFRVHRRPLTGSTAGITPVLRRRGLSGEKMGKERRLLLKTLNREKPEIAGLWVFY
jgi:hypothetical protein